MLPPAGELATVPIDVVKTRLQLSGELGASAKYNGAVHAVRTIVREEGLAALYKGTVALCASVICLARPPAAFRSADCACITHKHVTRTTCCAQHRICNPAEHRRAACAVTTSNIRQLANRHV